MSYKNKDVHYWTENDWNQHRKDMLKELPVHIKNDAVTFLKVEIPPEYLAFIKKRYTKFGQLWEPCRFHADTGMYIRNRLREKVARDNVLPSNNWDDYYMVLLEIATGVRDDNGELT